MAGFIINDGEPEELFCIAGVNTIICLEAMDESVAVPNIDINDNTTELRLSKGQLCYILFR